MTAAKQNDNLFAQASRPPATLGTIVLFIITLAMVIGGFYLMGTAFDHGESMTSVWLFVAGLALDTIGFWIAFGFIPSREKAAIDDVEQN